MLGKVLGLVWRTVKEFWREGCALLFVGGLVCSLPWIVETVAFWSATDGPAGWCWDGALKDFAEKVIRWSGMLLQLGGVLVSVWGVRKRLKNLFFAQRTHTLHPPLVELGTQPQNDFQGRLDAHEAHIARLWDAAGGLNKQVNEGQRALRAEAKKDAERGAHYALAGGIFFLVGIFLGSTSLELSKWSVCGV